MTVSPPRPLALPLSLLATCALGALLFAPSAASAATVTSFPGETDEQPTDETTNEHDSPAGRAEVRKRKRTVLGDLSSRWFHIGGGAGMVVDPLTQQSSMAGRFILGGGAYTIGLYGGGGMEVTGSAITTPSLSGVGYFGVAVPVPVVHPLIGVRGHVGLHPKASSLAFGGAPLAGHVGAGLQAGFIIRKFDGRPGLRLMVDGGVEYRPDEGKVLPDAFVTLAAVF